MAYANPGGRLPFESASKVGHLPIMRDPLIDTLLQRYGAAGSGVPAGTSCNLDWQTTVDNSEEITTVISSDGSYYESESDGAIFVRAGIQRLPSRLPTKVLHPFLANAQLEANTDSVQTVLPKWINCTARDFERLVRKTIFDTCASKDGLLDTIRWFSGSHWEDPSASIFCRCPYCGEELELSDDQVKCSCGETVYLTDVLDWDDDLQQVTRNDGSAVLATRFMLVLEFLLLLDCIRKMWIGGREELAHTLFLRDGPLTIGGHHRNLLRALQDFFCFAYRAKTPVLIAGVEKSGRMVRHLSGLHLPSPIEGLLYAVPSRKYVQTAIDGRPTDASHRYGDDHILGDRVFVRIAGGRELVLSVPSRLSRTPFERPVVGDLIGLPQIMAVLPALVTPVYDNALFPITKINAAVSIGPKPCGRLLEQLAAQYLH